MIKLFSILFAFALEIIPAGDAFLKPLQQRDSILIADQLEYGFTLENVKPGVEIGLQDFSEASNDTLTLVRNWKLDTLKHSRKSESFNIKAAVVIAPFEEGSYHLPELFVALKDGSKVDTLSFKPLDMEVKTMPVDTATFQIHDIKPQKKYPVTFKEVLPYILAFQFIACLIILIVCLIRMRKGKLGGDVEHKDPAYIVALRALDRFRSDKHWAPEKQKAFYSGVTDALKAYIDERFGVDAPEMTTAELFAALKGNKDLTPELYSEAKDLFERADFVKFAKYVASDEENAKVLPAAVKFVTSTYQTQLEEEQGKDVL